MKIKEELDKKLSDLTEEKLAQVSGGSPYSIGEECPEEILDLLNDTTHNLIEPTLNS